MNEDAKPSGQAVIGRHEAVTFAGPDMLKILADLAKIVPRLDRHLVDAGFASMLGGSAIGYREWAMLTLATLTAIGDSGDQTQVYLSAAVAHGATDDEILDLIDHACLYAGAPRAVTAARRIADYLESERSKRLPGVVEAIVRIGDHDTLVWDNRAEGPPILLIHALGLDRRFWREVYPHLAAVGRVIAYDIRGHGSARGAPPTTSLDHLADDARLLLDTLGVGPADIYGASYGGAIAQHLALDHPGRVRSLGLIACPSKAPREDLEGRAASAERDGMEAQVAASMMRWFSPGAIAADAWEVRYARNCVRRARVEDWAAAWRAMARLDVTARVGDFRVPIRILSGKQDLSASPEAMVATARAFPDSDFRSIDPGTHLMPLEQPGPVSAELVAFRGLVDAMNAGQKGESTRGS